MYCAHDGQPPAAALVPAKFTSRADSAWYVVETLPRREAIAIQNLALQHFSTFWPRFRKIRTHARRATTVLASLFPNYVFVQIDPDEGRWRSINGTYGVKRLVASAGGRPLPIGGPTMRHIFARCEQGVMTRLLDEYAIGQLAKVISGPLAEQLVTIERLDDNGRVRVLMDLLGTKVSATLPVEALGPR